MMITFEKLIQNSITRPFRPRLSWVEGQRTVARWDR
jgi:hypothetical protein